MIRYLTGQALLLAGIVAAFWFFWCITPSDAAELRDIRVVASTGGIAIALLILATVGVIVMENRERGR